MTGRYSKAHPDNPRFTKLQAYPGVAASMNERNRSPQEGELNIKPITTQCVNASNYEKGAYLKPYANQRKSTGVEGDGRDEGDKLGLQPQIHKRFLSIGGTVTTKTGVNFG